MQREAENKIKLEEKAKLDEQSFNAFVKYVESYCLKAAQKGCYFWSYMAPYDDYYALFSKIKEWIDSPDNI
jgi:hypothetical protein